MQTWWQAHKDQPTTTWLYLDALDAKGKNPLKKQPDASLLATGKGEKNETYTIVARTMQKKITALRLEALADKTLPKMGPGRGPNGGFVLSAIALQAAPLVPAAGQKPMAVKLRAGQATFEAAKFPLSAAPSGAENPAGPLRRRSARITRRFSKSTAKPVSRAARSSP